MLTIFSIPKPFAGHIGTIQRNAITSWIHLRPRPEVILLGDEDGTAELASELGVRHLPDVERNGYGTPLVSSVFQIASASATHDVLCYVNADIILLSDFAAMVPRVCRTPCLVVGCRTDLDNAAPIDFSRPTWESHLRRDAARIGRLHSHRAIDYFLFPRGLWGDLPPFVVGRLMWDNWLIYDARRRGLRVVDATRVVTAVHQNHGYSTAIQASHGGWNWEHPETRRNLELAGGHDRSYTIRDCTHVLLTIGIWPAIGRDYLRQRLERPPFRPQTAGLWSQCERAAITGCLRVHGLWNRVRRTFARRTYAS